MESNFMFGIICSLFLLCLCFPVLQADDNMYGPYKWISKLQSDCEAASMSIATSLADSFNSFDENTEWDVRIHSDFMTQYLGFAAWIVSGVWHSGGLTATGNNAHELHQKGGWTGSNNISESNYWALNNKWLYLMGDSTTRQVWSSLVSGFGGNNFERNAKEWTRENCARQYPHRKAHPADHWFPEEGWGGRCGNNEVTCDMSGYGSEGIVTFDWKHFPWEDYDEWLYGEDGKWGVNSTRRPDYIAIQIGLHTCFHVNDAHPANHTMLDNHINDIKLLLAGIRRAIDMHHERTGQPKTIVIIVNGGRPSYGPDVSACSWKFNRMSTIEAHKHGFVVLEREEMERRLLFRSEHNDQYRNLKPILHLEMPAQSIIATAMVGLVSCLVKNETFHPLNPFSVFVPPGLPVKPIP